MVTTTYNLSELHAHVSSVRMWPGQFNRVLAEALNETGNAMVLSTVGAIAQETGLTIAATANYVTSLPATPSNLVYEMRVQAGMIETELNSRPLPQRGFPQRQFSEMTDESTMVNLVTMKDGKVCPICEMIEKEGPYSMEEFNRLRDVHPHLLNKALNCRCSLVPFKPEGREPAHGGTAHIDLHNAQHDLAANIRAKTRQMIKDRGS